MPDKAFKRVRELYRKRAADEAKLTASLAPGEFGARRDEFLLDVGEDVARLLVDMAVGLRARTIVELGTSYGYSTLFLAHAAKRTGGKLYSYEIAPEKQAYAKDRIAEAGLSDFVEWRLGDAVELLKQQPGPIDFVLLDLWKDLYVSCFERIYPKLAPTGIIVADNMLHPEIVRPQAEAYRAAVRAKPDMEGALLHIGNGIDVAVRRSATS
jgi:predicted O-methyltransferase YrrM